MEISQELETAATLASENRVVPRGLLVVEKDTGRAKLGTGGKAWNDLPYWEPDGGAASDAVQTNLDYVSAQTQANRAAAGVLVPESRYLAFGASTVGTLSASGQFRLHYFTAPRSETYTTMTTWTGGTAAGATPTLCRYGLYSIASNGAGTLVASTANDTALWAAQNTAYPKAFSTPYAATAGQRYALGVICVTGAAVPVLVSPVFAALGLVDAGINFAPRLAGTIASQTDLPESFTDAGLSASRCLFTARLT